MKKSGKISQHKVKVYTQPTCPECNSLKDYLDRNNIPYEDIDVVKNKEALDEMAKKYGIRITPLVVIGDQVMIGFNVPKLNKLLSSVSIEV
ncbi:NrdH-redoxin [Methanocella sp. CWC-04]|uniref:NrdH-redoxin n=1 Tax=Methanooceanicella nereidis TaxID=2052831 RepID=A0AAP2RCH1_9EURY|nr:glutaredoxin family protein [Methanocella sp. CWC-04]MCD1295006.1 NrdH-redoxin [Methanocella sp. CWC-04]